jgi:hypothetical protein
MRNSKKYTVSSQQTDFYGKTSWSVWTYANTEAEYMAEVEAIEAKGYRARVIERETKKVVYLSK